ncbi:hypothetical protein SD78_1831 [Bacillus badius]|nr:hypothetical protein SD78_1831 [Bacillus badius]
MNGDFHEMENNYIDEVYKTHLLVSVFKSTRINFSYDYNSKID